MRRHAHIAHGACVQELARPIPDLAGPAGEHEIDVGRSRQIFDTMRPGDHPEFFRFPAPEGRSRESSIVLDREGRFHHNGALVEHPGMARAFASWIDLHPDDGRFILNNGYDWSYFRVEDVPFFAL